MSRHYDDIPVKPGEAESLPTHVEACSERYMALVRWMQVLSVDLRRQRFEGWLYRTATLALLGFLAWYLRKLADHMPFVP